MRHVKTLAVSFLLLLVAPAAFALPINYGLRLTAETGTVVTRFLDFEEGEPHIDHFEEESAVGNVYFGSFAVDSELLVSDGLNKPANVLFFSIKVEDNIWAYNAPFNNSFGGFRGPTVDSPDCGYCLGASSPGFDVLHGEITGFRGTVRSPADTPEVAFAPDTFTVIGSPQAAAQSRYGSTEIGKRISGRMELFRVPEPGTVLLLVAGLLGYVAARFRNLKRTQSSTRKRESR